ncbi:hypothetical protein AJ79_02216 [Helicocarpus griseus UAMH5409]|uniref:Uncharacterized protein n=1 Tax=Helicocarpus griseus UAMH5409 TaxID=1447875 RepID=A0A2B7Y3P8_9EURO|nr:hypothetical protein AJ79_02216 [Helicocarpus griseus UAMH5409]
MVGWKKLFRRKKSPSPTPPATPSPTETFDPFRIFPPPTPDELIRNRDAYTEQLIHRKFIAPRGEMEDKPLYALYRLYEYIVLDNNIDMRNELETFWWSRWTVADIPDPGEQGEPARYAVLSCIPHLLVESFNRRIDMGLRREEPSSILSTEEQMEWAATPKKYESVPEWARRVPPVEAVLKIPHTMDGKTQIEEFEDERASLPFKEKNILLWHPHIHFL